MPDSLDHNLAKREKFFNEASERASSPLLDPSTRLRLLPCKRRLVIRVVNSPEITSHTCLFAKEVLHTSLWIGERGE